MAIRARNARGRLLHFKVWPPGHNVEVTCCICGKKARRMKSDLRPGQRITTDSPACKALAMMLWPLGDRAAVGRSVDTARTPPR